MELALAAVPGGVVLHADDEDGNRAEALLACAPDPAEKPDRALDILRRQLGKTGGTDFAAAGVAIEIDPAPFLPVSAVNALRREVLERLSGVREAKRPRVHAGVVPNDAPFPEKELSYLGNVLNRDAEAFYRRHGVVHIEPAAESGLDLRGRKVMTTRYCLKDQLGLCGSPEPLALIDEQGNRLELDFDCAACEMSVFLERRPGA